MAKLFLPLIFLPLLLTGCFAVQYPSSTMAPLAEQVVSVGPSTVQAGIRAALQGHAGTTILQCGEHILVVWTYTGQNSAGFFAVNAQTGQVVNAGDILRQGGNLANSRTVSDLVNALKASGWQNVVPSTAPAILAQLATSRLFNMPVILLAVGVFGEGGFEEWFDQEFYPQEYIQ